MSKGPAEERHPLLLYFVDNENENLSKTNKRLYFDKGRLQGINRGATAIISEWPNYVNTCWAAAILFCLILFMIMLSAISTMSVSQYRIPRCIHNQNNDLFDNKTVHLVHGIDPWTEKQLNFADEIIQAFPNYRIHLVNINPKPVKSTTLPTPPSTILSSKLNENNGTTEGINMQVNNKRGIIVNKVLVKRRKRNLEKRLENLQNSFKMRAKRFIDILINTNNKSFDDIFYPIEATTEMTRIRTLNDLLRRHPEIVLENTTYEDSFEKTPLNDHFHFYPDYLKVFALRILQLWQWGGISFDLDFQEDLNKPEDVTEIIINPSVDKNLTVKPTTVKYDNNYAQFLELQHLAYENLPYNVVTADDKGIHMECKTACHAFFGEILMNLRKLNGRESVKNILRFSLKRFCKHSVADQRYCTTL